MATSEPRPVPTRHAHVPFLAVPLAHCCLREDSNLTFSCRPLSPSLLACLFRTASNSNRTAARAPGGVFQAVQNSCCFQCLSEEFDCQIESVGRAVPTRSLAPRLARVGRSVGPFRLTSSLRCAQQWVGRSGRSDSNFRRAARGRGSVGRTRPSQNAKF